MTKTRDTADIVTDAAATYLTQSSASSTYAEKSAGYQYNQTLYYTSNATFTKATYPWLRAIRVKCQGSGGGGGGCAAITTSPRAAVAGGGGAGAYAESFITDIAGLSASVTVTVASGGAGGAAGANNGGNGGTTSFGSTVSALGGAGGEGQAEAASIRAESFGGNGQTNGTGDLVIWGQGGEGGLTLPNESVARARGGKSFLGATIDTNRIITSAAGAGGNKGSGGGGAAGTSIIGTHAAQAGGAGGNGIVIVELYA
jgi:hypothetical protein